MSYITIIGISVITIYVTVQLGNFYGISISSYINYIAFWFMLTLCYMIFPKTEPEM